MTIFFDTNILISHIFNHEPIKELFELSKEEKIKIYISEMVLWEFEKHFIKDINREIGNYNIALANLSKLIFNKNKKFTYNKRTIKYFFNNIKDKLIKNYKIKIAYFDHENIIDSMKNRYLESKAPFHNEGDNFKDYIIWESYREIINKNKDEEYIFISNNLKDFSDAGKNKQPDNKTNIGRYSIHKDFLKDIKNANLISYTNIDSFKQENKNYKNIYKKYLFEKFESDRTNISTLKELLKFKKIETPNFCNEQNPKIEDIEILDNSSIVVKGENSIETDVKVTREDTLSNSERNEIEAKCIFTIDTQNLDFDFYIDIFANI